MNRFDDEHGRAKSETDRSYGADVCPSKRKQLDLATVKAQIEETTGPEYWRSLEELAGSEEFQEMMHREFPKGASEWLDDFSRRGFLKTMGASLALAGLTGCTRMPITEIVPYVRQPENVVPGRADVLRDRVHARRLRVADSGGEPPFPSDEG